MLHRGSVDWGAERKSNHKAGCRGREAEESARNRGGVGDQPGPEGMPPVLLWWNRHSALLCRRRALDSTRLSITFKTIRVTASSRTEMSARCPYDSTGRVGSMRGSVFSRADWMVSGPKERCPASSSLAGRLWGHDLVSGSRRTCHGATTGVQCGDQNLDRVECAVG